MKILRYAETYVRAVLRLKRNSKKEKAEDEHFIFSTHACFDAGGIVPGASVRPPWQSVSFQGDGTQRCRSEAWRVGHEQDAECAGEGLRPNACKRPQAGAGQDHGTPRRADDHECFRYYRQDQE